MSYELPPILKASERLLLDIEQAVRLFPRYHKYAIGAELRAHAREVCRLARRAWFERGQTSQLTSPLVWAVDEVKLSLQLAKQLQAFNSFGQFEALARQANDLGRQAGGWHRQLHPKAQNSPERSARPGRGQILSTRAASQGANR